jgi:hypothetical protein
MFSGSSESPGNRRWIAKGTAGAERIAVQIIGSVAKINSNRETKSVKKDY